MQVELNNDYRSCIAVVPTRMTYNTTDNTNILRERMFLMDDEGDIISLQYGFRNE
jgi:hypothetical protein